MIDETPLTAILSLARTGSFQDSARELDVSNATLSRIVRKAEAQLDMVLFSRGRSGCVPTAEGAAFLPLAERLLSDLGRFQSAAQALLEPPDASLSIGCGPLTTRTIVVPALQDVLTQMPELRAKVVVRAAEEPIRQLESGEIDIFVGDLTHTPWTEKIEIQMLAKRPVVFVARRDHPLHAGGPHSIKEVLGTWPFGAPFLHKHWQAALTAALGGDDAAARIARSLPQIECDDYALLSTLCRETDLVAGGMAESFAEYVARGELRPIQLTRALTWNICIARRLGEVTPAEEGFWKAVLVEDARAVGV